MAIAFQNYNFIGDNFASGGINTKFAVTNIKDNESPNCQNVTFSTTGSISKRKGFSKLNFNQIIEGGSPQVTTGIYQHKKSDGTSCVIVGAGTKLYDSATSPTIIKSGQASGALYDFTSLNDFAFIVNGVDPNLKYDCTTITALGIDAPISPPVLTDLAIAGNVNGTVQYVYTYVTGSGAESNPSPAASITIVNSQVKVDFTVSPDPQVTARNIYRTFGGGAIFFLLATIPDNVTTTYTDNVLDSDLGREVEFDNDKPPILKYIETHKDRLFGVEAANPNRLRFSKQFRPEEWPILNSIDVSPDDGDMITAIVDFFDQLVIFKRQSIYILSGNNETDFVLQRAQTDSRVGALSNRTAVVLDNVVAFLSERGIYAFDGLRTQYISQALEGLFDTNNPNTSLRFNWSQEAITVASNYKNKSRNWYFLSIPTDSSFTNNLILVFDYVLKNWTIFTGIYAHSLAIVTESNEPKLYSGDYNGFLWKQDDTDNDGFVHFPAFSTGGNTVTTLNDITQAWPVNALRGVRVKILDGFGFGQIRTIASNTATQITIDAPWDAGKIPNVTSDYSIGFIESEWQSRWFHYNIPEYLKRLMYVHVNTSREGDYNLKVILRFDFNDSDTVIRDLPLSGIGSLWDISFWDIDVWDQINTIITRLTNDSDKIHRYVKIVFRNDAGKQPYSVNSFNYLWQQKGIRH